MSMYPACQSYPVLPYSFQNLINSSTNKCFVLQQWRLFGHVSAAAVLKVFVGSFSDVYLSVVEKSTLASERLENLNDMVSEIHAIISATKPLITWSCRDAAQESREACGGHGFLKSARIGDIRNVNDPCVTYEGDNNVLVQQTSNWLLRQWQMLLEENRLSSPLKSCTFLSRKDSILSKHFNGSILQDVLNIAFITESFEWLVTYLLSETDAKQKLLLSNGQCRFTARNNSQVYNASVLSRVYGEFVAFTYYCDHFISKDIDDSSRMVLEKLGMMYGLWCLDKHLVFFYQGNFASGPALIKLIKDGVLYLCKTLKPDVIGVIDALAPPDFALNSVLGKADGKLYQNLQTEFFHNEGLMSRPHWWKEIIIHDAPEFKQYRSKL